MSNGRDLRLTLALLFAHIGAKLSQLILHRSGETIGGRIALFLDPNALSKLAEGKRIILVSATNGKTSTTRALAKFVGELSTVATNQSGANLHYGATSALMQDGKFAVLEVDELHLPQVMAATKPELVLLLNLTRDQLHRMHEVKRVADLWAKAAGSATNTRIILDVDDPFLAYVAQSAHNPTRISFGGRAHKDGAVCPQCGQYLDWEEQNFSCACGLTNRKYDRLLHADTAAERNLALAQEAAKLVGVITCDLTEINMERSEIRKLGDKSCKFRLTKNPASWTEALNGVNSDQVILVLNAREVDGIDTSWIYDVDFTPLRGRKIMVTGERGLDLLYRLHIQGISAQLHPNFVAALSHCDATGEIQVLCAYTAYFELVAR